MIDYLYDLMQAAELIPTLLFGVSFSICYVMAKPSLWIRDYLSTKFRMTILDCAPCSIFWLSPFIYVYAQLPSIFTYPFYMTAILLVFSYAIERFNI